MSDTVSAQAPRTVHSARTHTGPVSVLRDLAQGFAIGPLWRAFAWDEIQNRYRRSFFGIAWIVISYLIFVLAISFFFGGFAAMDGGRFTAYVAVGYAAFTFLIGNVTDGCVVFSSAASWM